MRRVLLWGTGNIYKEYKHYFFEMNYRKEIEILALVSRDKIDLLDNFHVISAEMVKTYEYDKIIICAENEMYFNIQQTVEQMNIDKAKVQKYSEAIKASEAIKKSYGDMVETQCRILSEILKATDEMVSSYEWIHDKIVEFGVSPKILANDEIEKKSIWGILQVADEFAKFCNYISKIHVEKALEVGVYKGRSSYFICALLMRNNPNLKYICVDIMDQLDSYEKYKEVLPALEKRIPSTSEDFKGEEFDFVFIDADHSYEGSMSDYMNVGQYAKKITAFHDVNTVFYNNKNGGTVRTWREVNEMTPGQKKTVFSKAPNQYGIGCVIWN